MTTLGELVASQETWTLIGDPATPITDIQYDSRLVAPGALFVALRGGYVDGHEFIDAAIRIGAAAVMVERQLPVDAPQIIVPDSRAELATAAAAYFGHPSRELDVIGVTGTDGKTTTAYFLDHILRSAGRVTGMIGTVSVRIGDETVDHETRQTTPESADIQRLLRRMVTSGVSEAIVEATSHGLDLHRLDHVRFTIGVVTNITQEHLEHHKTREAYWKAKRKLFDWLEEARGVAVINLDDEGARSVVRNRSGPSTHEYVAYSLGGGEADLCARVHVSDLRGTTGKIEWLRTRQVGRFEVEEGEYPFSLPMPGAFNVCNALAAIGASLATGVALDQAISSIGSVPAVPGRMSVIDCGQPFAVVVDYAHTPESLEKVLELLRKLRPSGKLIAVYGSAGERDVIKRPIQGRVVAELADISIITNEDPRYEDAESIIEEIALGAYAAGGVEGDSVYSVIERREAIRTAFALALPGDTVLLAGKGHERSIIWSGIKHPWDEASVAREELAVLGWS
jgi:UDP-N-acetylmuramoyl-L-alanyl-D-glutamate--2,6-diaminopimelate ligase